jgi:hypothetical protein
MRHQNTLTIDVRCIRLIDYIFRKKRTGQVMNKHNKKTLKQQFHQELKTINIENENIPTLQTIKNVTQNQSDIK